MKFTLGIAALAILGLASCGSGTSNSGGGNSGGGGGGGGTGGGGGGGGGGSLQSVNHIVIMMQENRSFDHYFGNLGAYRAAQGAGAATDIDGTPANVSEKTWCSYTNNFSTGGCAGAPANVSPVHMITHCTLDLTSNWQESHNTINLYNPSQVTGTPPMDGAAAMQGGYAYNSGPIAPNTTVVDAAGQRALGYYDQSDLPFYYWAATQFATSNRWFSAAPARTQINRMYLLAATSQGHVEPPPWASFNPTSIFEVLQNAGVTWKVYVTDSNQTPISAGSYMSYFTSFTPKYEANFVDAKVFLTDAANGTLPQVSLIESGYESGTSDSNSEVDEHPQANVQVGAAYVESLVTALMNGPSWKDSVFFLTYDEFGGFYDHVPPMAAVSPDGIKPVDIPAGDPQGDFTISGLRVPLVVISPFTKPHYVSNTPADFTAMLKFIETRFNLQPLNKRDAAQPDMTEFFDWSAPNMTPGTPPVQPTNGACYYNAVP